MKRALCVLGLALALLLATFPAPRVSAYTGILDQTYCENTLSGTWSSWTCQITTGTAATLPTGDTVTILPADSLEIASGATLNVNGALAIQTGTLINDGTLYVGAGGEITAYGEGSTAGSWALVQNNGHLYNAGDIRIQQSSSGGEDAALDNTAGSGGDPGTISNELGGTITITSQEVTNAGELTNNGTLNIQTSGRLDNRATFTNASSLTFWGQFNQGLTGASFRNQSTGTVYLFDGAELDIFAGSATNNGTVSASAGSHMDLYGFTNNATIDSSATVNVRMMSNAVGGDLDFLGPTTVEGTLFNHGDLESTDLLTVTGRLNNYGISRNRGTLHIGGDSSPDEVTNEIGASFHHEGAMTAESGVTGFVNHGTVDTYSTSTIDLPSNAPFQNDGTVEHRGWLETAHYVDNYDGLINEYCGAVILGTVNGGTVNDLCVGTVVIEKSAVGGDATFSYTGSGQGIAATFSVGTSGGAGTRTFSDVEAHDTKMIRESTPPEHWTFTSLSCSSSQGTSVITETGRTAEIYLEDGDTVTCQYVNTKDAQVIVEKVMEGGTDSFSFSGTPAGSIASDGGILSAWVTPGQVTSTEDPLPSGWTLTDIVCDDGDSTGDLGTRTATFNAAAGEVVRCTFTNTEDGRIIVDKVTDPAGSPQSFPFTTTGAGYSAFSLTDGAQSDQRLAPGDYSVTEDVPAGWDLTDLSCSSTQGTSTVTETTNAASVALAAGDTVRCTFTNTQRGRVVVEKVTDPTGAAQSFPFITSGAGYGGFSLTDGTQNDQELAAGTYTLAEDVPAGWELTGLSCTSDGGTSTVTETAPSVAIDLAPADTVRCTITNTQQGTIVVRKTTDPAGGSGFVFSDTIAAPYTFSLADGESRTFTQVSPGSYVITETVAWGWMITDVVCSDGSPTAVDLGTAVVDLEPGELVTCTFSNQALDSDGDGVCDYVEGAGDRDKDGIPDYEDYDPAGYFYDEETGRIISGGLITVTGPTTVTLLHDGSEGFYQFVAVEPAGTYTMAVELPPRYALSDICLPQDPPPFDPTGGPNPTVLGYGENGTTGHLTSTACTRYYFSFDLQTEDPPVLNNNIPLRALPPVGGATLAPPRWGLLALGGTLAALTVVAVAVAALVRRRGD